MLLGPLPAFQKHDGPEGQGGAKKAEEEGGARGNWQVRGVVGDKLNQHRPQCTGNQRGNPVAGKTERINYTPEPKDGHKKKPDGLTTRGQLPDKLLKKGGQIRVLKGITMCYNEVFLGKSCNKKKCHVG